MTLTLRAVALNDQPIRQPITAHFDSNGGTIGRTDQNTLTLPDPDRHISRQQATISVTASGYAIRNTGSANPLFVRDRTLVRGDSATLSLGDELRIGGYRLVVIDDDADDSAAHAVTRPFSVADFAPTKDRGLDSAFPIDPLSLLTDRRPAAAATSPAAPAAAPLAAADADTVVPEPQPAGPPAIATSSDITSDITSNAVPDTVSTHASTHALTATRSSTDQALDRALDAALFGFAPRNVEVRLEATGDAPTGSETERRAWLWDQYGRHFASLCDEAADDARAVFRAVRDEDSPTS
jgi:predicted component of type VI protein secretion system